MGKTPMETSTGAEEEMMKRGHSPEDADAVGPHEGQLERVKER
jgi:hypothetical protein